MDYINLLTFFHHVINNKLILMIVIIYLRALVNIYSYLTGCPAKHSYTSLVY